MTGAADYLRELIAGLERDRAQLRAVGVRGGMRLRRIEQALEQRRAELARVEAADCDSDSGRNEAGA